MKKKIQVLVGLGAVCVLLASFALVYAAWTPEQMAAYMGNIGRHKIYQTNWILYNEIGPKMGQGMVGQFKEGTYTTKVGVADYIWEYKPGGKPKKLSLYVNLVNMHNGDDILFYPQYRIKGALVSLDDQIAYDGSVTKTFYHSFQDMQGMNGKLILDQLPIATHTSVVVYQGTGVSFKIDYQVLREEL